MSCCTDNKFAERSVIHVERHGSFATCEKVIYQFCEEQRINNPFLHVTWLKLWWQFFGAGHTLCILLFRHENRIAGYAPLYSRRVPHTKIHEYFLVGHRKASYLDIPCVPYLADDVISAACEYFSALPHPSVLYLMDLNDTAVCLPVLRRHFQASEGRNSEVQAVSYPLYPCPSTRLGGSWQEILNGSISKSKYRSNFKRSLKRSAEQLGHLGEVTFTIARHWNDVQAVFPKLRRLHAARFTHTVNRSMDGVHGEFMEQACRELLGRGLSVSFLSLDGEPITLMIGIEFDGTYVNYIPAFDPVFSEFSPGHLHIQRLAQQLIEDGFTVLDMSKGDGIYKRKWSSYSTWNHLLMLSFNSTPTSRLYFHYKKKMMEILLWGRHSGWNNRIKAALGRLPRSRRKQPRDATNGRFEVRIVSNPPQDLTHTVPLRYSVIKEFPDEVRQFFVNYQSAHTQSHLQIHRDSPEVAVVVDAAGQEERHHIDYQSM